MDTLDVLDHLLWRDLNIDNVQFFRFASADGANRNEHIGASTCTMRPQSSENPKKRLFSFDRSTQDVDTNLPTHQSVKEVYNSKVLLCAG